MHNEKDKELLTIFDLTKETSAESRQLVFGTGGISDSIYTVLVFGKVYPWFSRNMVYGISYQIKDLSEGIFFTSPGEKDKEDIEESDYFKALRFKPCDITWSNFGDSSVRASELHVGDPALGTSLLFDRSKVAIVAVDPNTLEIFVKIPGSMIMRKLGDWEFPDLLTMQDVPYYFDRMPKSNVQDAIEDYQEFLKLEPSFRVCFVSTLIKIVSCMERF